MPSRDGIAAEGGFANLRLNASDMPSEDLIWGLNSLEICSIKSGGADKSLAL
jgi:hypothetical protein